MNNQDPKEELEVFVTKYALTTRGVFKVRGAVIACGSDRKPAFKPSGDRGLIFHGDWHVTKSSAEQRIKEMIASGQKKLVRKKLHLDKILNNLKAGSLPTGDPKKTP